MPISIGQQLGSYEITALLGKGGMGEVYRARDAKLKREVAIKTLPEKFSSDTDRVSRFQREAEVLASLNHPNIAGIYDLQEVNGERYLVLELVEGETLANRIARGPIPVDEALKIANGICEALQAAHDKGIIHRDLKPANVKITPDGNLKVLDFGLAKAIEGGPTAPTLSNSPTVVNSLAATDAGVIIGTAAYMSPEQARGFAADQRGDIFAFGCVMYEMLTGRQAFQGETVSDILASVLARDADFSGLPKNLNPALLNFLRRCLAKNRKHRWHCVGDLHAQLESLSAQPTVLPIMQPDHRRNSWKSVFVGLCTTTILLGAAAIYMFISNKQPKANAARFLVSLPERQSLRTFHLVSISPDGKSFAYLAGDPNGKFQWWTQSIDSLMAKPISNTEGASSPLLIWSPDGLSIALFLQNKLKRAAINGAGIQTICDATNFMGGSWNAQGIIVFAPNLSGELYRVAAAGGQPTQVTKLENSYTSHRYPQFLPDQRHFLFFAVGAERSAVFVGDLQSQTSKYLFASETAATYVAPGYLLFSRQGVLLAQKFDAKKLSMVGDPQPITEPVQEVFGGNYTGIALFSASDNGVLAYRSGGSQTLESVKLMWVDRTGHEMEQIGDPGPYRGVELSPDGKRLAVHRHDGSGGDIWIFEANRPAPLRLTFDASQENSSPIWSPDGRRIAFASFRNGMWGVYQKPSDNSRNDEMLFQTKIQIMPMSWSADNSAMLFWQRDASGDIWKLLLENDRKAQPLLNGPYNESHAQISPDGRWVSYQSNETGPSEIYVRAYPMGSGQWQVSIKGGVFPRWRPDGKELFYLTSTSNGKMMSINVNPTGSTFEYGAPKPLFDSNYENYNHGANGGYWHTYAVTRNGDRFLIPRPVATGADNSASSFLVLMNWPSLLK